MPDTQLICIPHAGASQYAYRHFGRLAPEGITVVPVELPGRGDRVSEPLCRDSDALAGDIFSRVQASITHAPYAVYGHSMGGLLGLLLLRRIAEAGLPPPGHFFVSGCKGPSTRSSGKPKRYLMPLAELKRELKSLGGVSDDLLENPEIMSFYEPLIRADFQATETYVYKPAAKLSTPITVMIGSEDRVTPAEAQAWQAETDQPVRVKEFPGDHFFIFQRGREVMATIREALC